MNALEYTDYLVHHGIKNQKWGVRRYQNEDGSLTEEGKKRYRKMSSEKVHKELVKTIRKTRSEQSDWSNQWQVHRPIGEETQKIVDLQKKLNKEYRDSPEYKKWNKEYESLFGEGSGKYDLAFESGKMSSDEYDKKFNELMAKMPKNPANKYNSSYSLGDKGKEYLFKEFKDSGNAEWTKAYIQDLGFNKDATNEILKKLGNNLLGDI